MKKRLRLYAAYSKVHFLYGCLACAESETIQEEVDAFRTRIIGILIQIYWPDIMNYGVCDGSYRPFQWK